MKQVAQMNKRHLLLLYSMHSDIFYSTATFQKMLVPAEEMEWTILSFWGTLPQAASECFVK
jgi:hypothetical protein